MALIHNYCGWGNPDSDSDMDAMLIVYCRHRRLIDGSCIGAWPALITVSMSKVAPASMP